MAYGTNTYTGYSTTSIIITVCVTAVLTLTSNIAWPDLSRYVYAPVLPSVEEVAWQGILHPLAPLPVLVDGKLGLLDEISIRTALEDTARRHGDLG